MFSLLFRRIIVIHWERKGLGLNEKGRILQMNPSVSCQRPRVRNLESLSLRSFILSNTGIKQARVATENASYLPKLMIHLATSPPFNFKCNLFEASNLNHMDLL